MKRNVEICKNKVSEPSGYLNSNLTHAFTWKVLMAAPINDRVR